MARDSLPPDVVEHGGYSEASKGPASDTTAYVTSTPLGATSRAAAPPAVTFDADKKPEAVLSRDKLSRSKPLPPAGADAGLDPRVRMAILAGLVILTVVALVALVFASSGSPEVAPAPADPAADAPAGPEAPRQVDGVPVERGLNRKPLPPKQK